MLNKKVLINTVLKTIVFPVNLSLIQAIKSIPKIGFVRHSDQSIDKLLRIAIDAEEAISAKRYKKVIELLDKLNERSKVSS